MVGGLLALGVNGVHSASMQYPHDKAEGLAIISPTLIAVSNDDDFGIVPDGKGGIAPKRLPGANNILDTNRIYFIKLERPLR
jgi:hypothetical protein